MLFNLLQNLKILMVYLIFHIFLIIIDNIVIDYIQKLINDRIITSPCLYFYGKNLII